MNPEKTPGARTRMNNKLNPLMLPGPGMKPGPHWWEASALTTVPSLSTAPSLLSWKCYGSRGNKGSLERYALYPNLQWTSIPSRRGMLSSDYNIIIDHRSNILSDVTIDYG